MLEQTGLWIARQPLVLASKSQSRRAVLAAAGIALEIVPADVDERAIEARLGDASPDAVARALARAKACAIAAHMPGRLVLGADQTLGLGERVFSKPAGVEAARAQLKELRGRQHTLHSALAVARDAEVLLELTEPAYLTMRAFSDAFLDAYLAAAGEAVTTSVGAYQVEALGIQLFEDIDGDHFTILGLPLFGLLAFLRRQGCLVD
jgi:septum formation protein